MSFKVESILSFILCPSSFIQRKSFILHPVSFILHPKKVFYPVSLILYPNVIPKVRWMRKKTF